MKFILSLVIFVFVKTVASQDYGPFDPDTVCEGYEDDDKIGYGEENSCTGYYSCYGGIGYPEECPEGTQFDYTINDCEDETIVQCQPQDYEYTDYPEIPEETEAPPAQTTQPTTTTRAGVQTTTDPNQIDDITCPTNQPGEIIFFPSSNCTEYYICANGNRLRMSCMEGFTWNQDMKQCDYPIFSKCSSNVSMDGDNVQCTRTGFYSTAYPRDCKKFVFCSNGIPIMQNCPIGYAWHMDRCVMREFALCPDLRNRL